MGNATLDDVIARLDALEVAVRELTLAVRARSRPAGLRQTSDALAREASAVATAPALQRTEAPRREEAPAPARAYVEESRALPQDDGDLPPPDVPGPEGSIADVLTRLFEAALLPSELEAYAIFAALTHQAAIQGPRSIDHLKAFNWRRLRKSAHRYLEDGRPDSFVIERTVPSDLRPEDDDVKLFIAQKRASGSPLRVARDATADGAWRVIQMSL